MVRQQITVHTKSLPDCPLSQKRKGSLTLQLPKNLFRNEDEKWKIFEHFPGLILSYLQKQIQLYAPLHDTGTAVSHLT